MGNNKKLTQVRDNVCIGMSSYGWICKREYARFYLWEKATRSGKTIKECFYKQRYPAVVSVPASLLTTRV